LVMPEIDARVRVVYLGETFTKEGKNFYWLYWHVLSGKVNRIVATSLESRRFLCDGVTISPFEDSDWGSVQHIVEVSEPKNRQKCLDLISKLKSLGVMSESA